MKSVVVGTAGHIDHGKSALVRALTGIDPDRLKEEKARGITIDLGFAHVAIGDVNVAFVDVPGHERFVKNMLAGVGGIDLVVLVVAADESVMPQTREHFDICRLLHVPAGLVAVTKADLVDADTLELVRLEIRELTAGSFLEGAPIVAVSSKTGEGLDALRAALVDAAARVPGRPAGGATRLPIDRVFSMKGFGTVVTGTLVSGRIRVDEELSVAPGDALSGSTRSRSVKVRGVQVHGARRDHADAGQRSAVNLVGVEVDDVSRGQSLVTPGAFEQTRLADGVLDLLPGAKPLRHGTRVRFHNGTAEILGRVAVIGPGPAASIEPGSRAFVRLRLERPAILTRGDRYILRAYSPPITIAGGWILDPRPPRGAIRSAAAIERCRQLDVDPASGASDGDVRALSLMIEGAGAAGLPASALVSRAGVAPSTIASRIDGLVARHAAVRIDAVLVAPAVLARLTSAIVDALRAHHAAQPLSDGMPREEVRERLFARGHPAVFERAIADLTAANTIGGRDRLALATHRVALSPDEDRARSTIERAFRDAGLKPPDVEAVASQAGIASGVADRVLKLLQRQKVLVKIDTLLFHDEALKQLKRDVAALKASAGGNARIDVGTFKERFGVTRKFAIPLLEYLDRERVTRRVGDARIVL
jgi:selenocysteine-specific elongation factor